MLNNVPWTPGDAITSTKLQLMSDDISELDRLRIRTKHQVKDANQDVVREDALKIYAGHRRIYGNNEQTIIQTILFPGGFSPSCTPTVTCTLSTPDRHESFVTISGTDGGDVVKADGFKAYLWHTESSLGYNAGTQITIHWMAVGW